MSSADDQLSFDMGGATPLVDRLGDPTLFFALKLPEDVADAVMASAWDIHKREGVCAPRPRGVLHLSLCSVSPFGQSSDVIDRARRVGETIAASRFDLTLTRSIQFRNNGAVVLGCATTPPELLRLREGLAIRVRQAGFHRPGPFTPHVTLLYENDRRVPESLLPAPIVWPVTDVSLVLSRPKIGHEILGRWALT